MDTRSDGAMLHYIGHVSRYFSSAFAFAFISDRVKLTGAYWYLLVLTGTYWYLLVLTTDYLLPRYLLLLATYDLLVRTRESS